MNRSFFFAFHHQISPDFIHFFHNALGEKHHNQRVNSEMYIVKDPLILFINKGGNLERCTHLIF